jgi:hypothetical protein
VVTANAWMNSPAGFTLVDGVISDVDPIAAMLNPAAFTQVLHMTLAAYAATGFATAGIHAIALLRGTPHRAFHRYALQIGLLVGMPAALLQPLSGDLSARHLAEYQPVKFAAMEAHHHTGPAPFVIGGWPDVTTGENRFAIEDSRGDLAAHDRECQQQHSGAGQRAAGRPPARGHRARGLSDHGGLWRGHDAGGAVHDRARRAASVAASVRRCPTTGGICARSPSARRSASLRWRPGGPSPKWGVSRGSFRG